MKSANYETTTGTISDAASWAPLKAAADRLRDFQRGFQLKLASSSAGRILLHLVLAVMTCHFAWHFHGIARELTRN